MKQLIALCLIIFLVNPVYARRNRNKEMTLSMYFQIHYNLLPPAERQKVEDMAKVLDEAQDKGKGPRGDRS